MLKDLILKSKRLLDREEDKLPLFMRGELEVIVRDDKDRIIDYQKGDNTVSNFMKHEIIHLLAGDLFSNEIINPSGSASIYTGLQYTSGFHSPTANKDGMLFSNRSFFYTMSDLPHKFVDPKEDPTNTNVGSAYVSPRYPVKMLFGTGKEYGVEDWDIAMKNYYGDDNVIEEITGYKTKAGFETEISGDTNYYSNTFDEANNTVIKTRTVQDKNTSPITSPALTKDAIFGITGAIKNGTIELVDDLETKYDSLSKTVKLDYKGVGRPSFIYASRNLNYINSSNISENPGYVKIGTSDGANGFENKLVFSVVMPRSTGFYPYDGWILKEAGLFSDSLFTMGGDPHSVASKMPCGTLLAKRYISPILKSYDNSVEFIWSIYITP